MLDGMQQTIADRDGFAPVMLAADEDVVGIVTVHDGPSLPSGEIIAPEVGDRPATQPETFHNNFQEPEKFLEAGGYRGRQLQVVLEGTWYINRLFATVEAVPKTIIPVGNVGVVVFYTGPKTDGRLGRAISPRRAGGERQPRRVAGSAAARQVRLQHLRRQGRDHPDRQLHPEMGAWRRPAR